MPKRVWRVAACAFLVAAVAGCAAKRSGYDVPEVPLPREYKNTFPSEPGAAESLTPPLPDMVPDRGLIEWWRFFGSPELERLIDRGIANNAEVRIATLRVAQAKARADQVRAGQLPEISAPLLVGRQMPGGTAVGSVPTTNDGRRPQTSYQASMRGTWRLDVWGEQSALAESANLQLWRAAFERDNTQRNLAATLASNYVEYASLNDRLQVARELESVLAATLPTIEKRVEVGDATMTELEQQRAAIYALRATIPTIEQQREDVHNAIAFLVGTVPGSLKLSDAGLDTLGLPSYVPGLPAALLLRRPDVRMAEARMLSADADIDVARARILPPVDLSAQVGYSSIFLGQMFQPQALFWNAIASLTASIFDAGKRSSEREYAQAVHEEMVETYIRTIYQAMREVEGSLATIRLASKRLDAQEEATLAAKRAWEISSKVYLMGGVDYMTLLDTERTYYRYLDDYQRTRMEHLRGYMTLFQSLGGGVQVGQVVPGRGDRPLRAGVKDGKVRQGLLPRESARVFSADGVEWAAGRTIEQHGGDGEWQVEEFFQVELVGLYHRAAIGAAWRDLRARYPMVMENRVLRPRLSGRIEDSVDGQEAWYRLFVAKFSTLASAEEFCAQLSRNQQRCRVVTSRSDEPVIPAARDRKPDATPGTAQPNGPDTERSVVETFVDAPPVAVPTGSAGSVSSMGESVRTEAVPERPTVRVVKKSGRKAGKGTGATASPPPTPERLAYTIQLGTFLNLDNAAIAHAVWQFRGYDVYVSENRDADKRVWYSVRTGVFPLRRDGVRQAQAIRDVEEASAVVVPISLGEDGRPVAVGAERLSPANGGAAVPFMPEPPEAATAPVAQPAAEHSLVRRAEPKTKPSYSVQLGAFSTHENAKVARDFWSSRGYDVFMAPIVDGRGRSWYAVRSGLFANRRDAASAALGIGRKERVTATVVMAPSDTAGVSGDSGEDPRKIRDVRAILEAANEGVVAAPDDAARPEVSQAGTLDLTAAAPVAQLASARTIYSIQLAAFSSLENARKSMTGWRSKGYETYLASFRNAAGRDLYAVRTGEYPQKRQADADVRKIVRKERARVSVVPAALDDSGRVEKVDFSAGVPGELISNGR